jgi:hypothetical protein
MATAPPKGSPFTTTLLELVVRLQSYGFRHHEVVRLIPRLVNENHVVLRGMCRNTCFRHRGH